jgi:hypothetical protein
MLAAYRLNVDKMRTDLSFYWVQHSRSLRLDGDYLDGIRVEMNEQIKTTALEWGSSRERREHRRKKCLLSAQLITNTGSYDCRVLDLSKGGAKLETCAVVNPEQAVTLVVKSIGTFAGLVAWCGDGLFGVRFLAQHGTTTVRTAPLRSSLRVAERSKSELLLGARVPPVTSEKIDVPDAVPRTADYGPRGRKAGMSMSERSFALHDGDVICLLRKKSNGQDPESKSLQTPGQRKKRAGSEFATFIEIGARDFLELAEQKWACTITFMRVVPFTRRRSSG